MVNLCNQTFGSDFIISVIPDILGQVQLFQRNVLAYMGGRVRYKSLLGKIDDGGRNNSGKLIIIYFSHLDVRKWCSSCYLCCFHRHSIQNRILLSIMYIQKFEMSAQRR